MGLRSEDIACILWYGSFLVVGEVFDFEALHVCKAKVKHMSLYDARSKSRSPFREFGSVCSIIHVEPRALPFPDMVLVPTRRCYSLPGTYAGIYTGCIRSDLDAGRRRGEDSRAPVCKAGFLFVQQNGATA